MKIRENGGQLFIQRGPFTYGVLIGVAVVAAAFIPPAAEAIASLFDDPNLTAEKARPFIIGAGVLIALGSLCSRTWKFDSGDKSIVSASGFAGITLFKRDYLFQEVRRIDFEYEQQRDLSDDHYRKRGHYKLYLELKDRTRIVIFSRGRRESLADAGQQIARFIGKPFS